MGSDILYVVRNSHAEILTINKTPPETGEYEALPSNHPDVKNFVFLQAASAGDIRDKLVVSDIEFIRVLDDLVNILIEKNIVSFTDFPEQAQKKLYGRSGLRTQLNVLDNFLNEEDELIL